MNSTINRIMITYELKLSAVTLAILTIGIALGQTIDKPKPMVEEFAKIESHLNKKIASEDVSANMLEVSALLKKESHRLIKRKRYIDAIEKFTNIDEMQTITNCVNGVGREYFTEFDRSLGYDASKMHKNLARRIDKIGHQYAMRFVEFCWDQSDSVLDLEAIFKQADYDVINSLLTDDSADLDENLDKASKMLSSAPAGSHLEEALQQFLSLKRLISKDSCNYDGYQIILRNELAIRGRSKAKVAARKIDKVIEMAKEKHNLICEGEYRKKYNTLVEQLSSEVISTMRKLVDNYLKKLMEEAKFLDLFGEQKTTENNQASDEDNVKVDRWVGEHEALAAHDTMRSLASDSIDPMTCKAFGNDKMKMITSGLVNDCYSKHLITPCKVFMTNIGKEVFMPQFYAGDESKYAALPTTEDDGSALSYNHGRIASLVCMRLIKNKRWIYKRLAQMGVKNH